MIKPPPRPDGVDRDVDCEMALEDAVHAIAEDALAAGWTETEIRLALRRLGTAWVLGRRENRITDAAIETARGGEQ